LDESVVSMTELNSESVRSYQNESINVEWTERACCLSAQSTAKKELQIDDCNCDDKRRTS